MIEKVGDWISGHQKVGNYFLYGAYVAFIVKKIIYSSLIAGLLPNPADNLVDALILGFLFIAAVLKIQNTLQSKALFTLLVLLGVIVKVVSTNLSILWVVLFVYAFRGEQFRTVCKVTALVTGISLTFVVLLSQVGIVEDHIWETGTRGDRHGLGFLYTSYLSLYFLNYAIVIMYLLRKSKGRVYSSAVISILIINYIIYIFTDTRATFYLIVFAIVGFTTLRLLRHFGIELTEALNCLMSFAYVPCAALSAVFTIAYDNSIPWQSSLNSLLSGRLALINASFNNYGILPFGRHVEMAAATGKLNYDGALAALSDGVDTNVVDNSYMSILLFQGVFVFVLVMIGFAFLSRACTKMKDSELAFILLILAIHALVDPQLIKIEYNTFIILIGCLLPYQNNNSICPFIFWKKKCADTKRSVIKIIIISHLEVWSREILISERELRLEIIEVGLMSSINR